MAITEGNATAVAEGAVHNKPHSQLAIRTQTSTHHIGPLAELVASDSETLRKSNLIQGRDDPLRLVDDLVVGP
jgi:hypothetical protein